MSGIDLMELTITATSFVCFVWGIVLLWFSKDHWRETGAGYAAMFGAAFVMMGVANIIAGDGLSSLASGTAEYRLVERDDGSREWVYTRKDGDQ